MKTTMILGLSKFVKYVLLVVILGLIVELSFAVKHKHAQYETARKNAICPALFSISRGARDTLIVMKAEPLCNVYILDSLK